MARSNPYDVGLDKNAANYTPLSPLSLLARTACILTMKGYLKMTPVMVHAIRQPAVRVPQKTNSSRLICG